MTTDTSGPRFATRLLLLSVAFSILSALGWELWLTWLFRVVALMLFLAGLGCAMIENCTKPYPYDDDM